MHAARLDHSPRLQRVHALLSDGVERSTLEIVTGAQVCAVNSCVAELRANGFYIECRQTRDSETGRMIWLYRMPFAGGLSPNECGGDRISRQADHGRDQ